MPKSGEKAARSFPGRRWLRVLAVCLLAPGSALGLLDNPSAVVGTKHDLSVLSAGPVKSNQTDACIFCHGSHLPASKEPEPAPLWNRALPLTTYKSYGSPTYDAGPATLVEGGSKLCLSCHDGTIAPGQTLSRGLIRTSGSLRPTSLIGTDFVAEHPVAIKPVDDGELVPSLFSSPASTADPAVRLYEGRVECLSCHSAHEPARDPVAKKFLVRSNSEGTLCLACHDPNRPQPNRLAGWRLSAHSTATNSVPTAAGFGPYGSVNGNACLNCHRPHGGGGVVAPQLLRGVEEAACESCHRGTEVSPPVPDVMRDFAKIYAHPATTLAGLHQPNEEAFPLQNNRHAECADCHQPHAAQSTVVGALPPLVQPALFGASGFDGAGPRLPAANEFEVCFKCHADSSSKPQNSPGYSAYGYTPRRQAEQRAVDAKNLREKFASTIARHNVTQPRRLSDAEVPSLRPFILYPDGSLGRSLAVGTYTYCIDCHASDTVSRTGGSGANGPHGSIYPHILAARAEQELPPPVAGSAQGQGVTYIPGSRGSYGLCNLCHDVENSILQDHSFSQHRRHVLQGRAACSTCHDPHGIHDGGGDVISNHRMVSFDLNIVAPDPTGNLTFESATQNCSLSCHGVQHPPERY